MRLINFALTLVLALPAVAFSATLPAGFVETAITGLSNPTAMQFAPDGRLFICEQGGRLRVVKDGSLLATPFLTIPAGSINSSGERGLLGVAFDPAFASNHFVYVYYTSTSVAVHNRISRFTANGDVAVAGSERIILELDNLVATKHNGGALDFGPDGKLYAATGENGVGSNAQSLANLLGKILRVNKDGTFPSDNPFVTSAAGRNRAIWALGLRNPFTFAFDPAGGQMFINDVGQDTWEEINDGRAGGNYGWPTTEGATTNPAFISPRYAYSHANGQCAITGGAFYSPVTPQFPADYARDYFFAEFCAGWINRLDVAANRVTTFATGILNPVDLKVSDDGALYYLARGANAVYRVTYAAAAPAITTQPASRTVAAGASATFSVRATGTPPLRYQWRRNGVDIAGATSADYRIAAVAAADNGARFRALVVNDFGNALSTEAVLTVTGGGSGTGSGLSAAYFDNANLTGATVSRIDPTIDFVLGSASPAPGIGPDTFSARWTGQVMPQFSQTYTFYTVSNDGVRLWVNGQRIVNNWTNHGTTENSGTIALTAGQRYAITMEWYEDTGNATARLFWSSASTPRAIVPRARLFPDTTPSPGTIRVNFQLASAPLPAGYLKDGGQAYGDRGNGRTYGWNIDNTAQMRDRNSSLSPDQRYDTLAYMQRPANPNAVWEIAVPNGTYTVHAVAGDAAYFDITYRIAIEGVVVVAGTSNSATRWIEGTSTITVTDGRLTLRSAAGATANKICFVDITPQ